MKRSRDKDDTRTVTKKSKSIQACSSCRKHKTRCEILDPSKSPVKCHRCQVLTLQCSYEDTLLPTASTSRLPESPPSEPPPPPTAAQRSAALKAYPPHMQPTDRMWSFVSDQPVTTWVAPMLAIQQLSKLPLAHLPAQMLPQLPPGDFTLPQILPEDRIRYLLELFDERYTPWLNFKLTRRTSGPLLPAVCCAVASRHLDNAAGGALIKMQLQKLTEDSIAKMIFNPRPSESVEGIQALLILSLWAPLGGPAEEEGRDGRLLIASAVSMAMNLRLNQASAKALSMRKSNRDPAALEEMMENARLWIALTNTESMLCTGTGRVPLSRRSPEDLQLFEFPKPFESVNYGDLRLSLTAQSFDLLEEAVSQRLTPGSATADVESWYDEIMIVLEKMKRVKRLLMPLPYVLEREQFYFHVLNLYQNMTRLLVLYHALWDARVSVSPIPPGSIWHTYFKPHGVETAGEWGRDMIQTAEALLVYVLATDTRMLSTCPDNIFTMITLAAGYVVAVKFLMYRGGNVLMGASDLLLAKTVGHLNVAACAPGHAAQRAAFLVTGMIARWEGREKDSPAAASTGTAAAAATPAATSPTTSYPTPTSDLHPIDNPPAPAPPPSTSTTPVVIPPPALDFFEPSAFSSGGGQHGESEYDQYGMPDLDFGMFMDSTIPVDAEFWNNLAQTQHLAGYR